MAVTIKDVAALAGVSPSTVSRTCKDHPSISAETKEKVRRVMQQLGYEPNFSSDGAISGSKTIGIILPPSYREAYENSFYLETIRGISQFCNKRQYIGTVITGQDEEEILGAVHTMSVKNLVEGFIVLYSRKEDMIVDYLCEEGYLYVLIGKASFSPNQTIIVDNDNLLAGQEATEYLYRLGHRKIAYVGNESMFFYSADRKSGYQLALLHHDLPVRAEYCVEVGSIPKEDMEQICRMLEHPQRPTAVVVSDDILAVALERVCLRMGLSIPKDLSIVSFNNSLFARLTSPRLTSVDVNSFQLGIEAASQMINHIENPNLLATKIIVPHGLIERDSCCRIDACETKRT